ncbi:MAG TPA: hypothetical protein DCS93_36735 [Microscillaceae bacterium]|nr:hypothetical protein [Microscillaceae bacterium]
MNKLRKTIGYLIISASLSLQPFKALANGLSDQDQRIFKKVWLALGIGDNIKTEPKVILKTTNMGTQIDQATSTIFIDPGLLEVGKSFGDQRSQALAFVFGQALYFYTTHKTFSLMPQKFARTSDKSRFLKGDKKGIIYAYMAGYPMLDIYTQLLRKIYAHYGLANAGFLQFRLNRANTLSKELRQFFLTFQIANYLMMVDEGLVAHECYKYILEEYESKEMYNNAGANLLKMMVEDDPARQFAYPVVMDLSSQLVYNSFKYHQKRITDALQTKMQWCFQEAIRKDANYIPAYINLANLRILTFKLAEANRYLAKAEKLAKQQNSPLFNAIRVLKGMLIYKVGKKMQAINLLAKLAQPKTKNLAYYNLLVAREAPSEVLKEEFPSPQSNGYPEETIADIDLDVPFYRGDEQAFLDGSAVVQFKIVKLHPGLSIYLDTLKNDQNQKVARRIVVAYRGKLIYFVQTLPGYKGKTSVGDFSIGSNFQKMKDAAMYGEPLRTQQKVQLLTKEYTFYIYDKRRIIFRVNHQQKVASWMIYYTTK